MVAHAHDFVVCLQMANLVTSLCCVILAAVVVAYAQRRSQLGEYALPRLLLRLLPPLGGGYVCPFLPPSSSSCVNRFASCGRFKVQLQ